MISQSPDSLCENHYPMVYSIAARLVKRYGFNDMDTAVSAGMFALVRCSKSFDPSRGIKFISYCYDAVRRHITAEIISTFENQSFIEPNEDGTERYERSVEYDVHADLERKQDVEKLREAITKLAPPDRLAVEMRLAGSTYDAIAVELGCSRQNAEMKFKSTILKLRKILQGETTNMQFDEKDFAHLSPTLQYVARLHMTGFTDAGIARKLGTTRQKATCLRKKAMS